MAKQKNHNPVAGDKTASAITDAFEKMRKDAEERNRTKNYDDLLRYAQKFNDLNSVGDNFPTFPSPLSISAQDTISPYYGTDFENQKNAAMQYSGNLGKSVVSIDPKYYEELTRQVPVKTADVIPHYNATKNMLVMPNPVTYANFTADLSQEKLSRNNFGTKEEYAKYLLTRLGDDYRDTIEHEAGHIADKSIQFSPKPRGEFFVPKKDLGLGYMANEDHLVTGLGKVQREWYAKTGQRFESPDQFKQFIFNIAKSEDPQSAISDFSEEAKRALRPQIQNAKKIQSYNNELDAWQKDKSWFKKEKPDAPLSNFDFLEKSSQLIPGLVSNYNPYEGLPA